MTDDINDVSHTSTYAKAEEAIRKDERSRIPVSARLTERLSDVIMMLDAPDAYNREYIAAVCRSILGGLAQCSREQMADYQVDRSSHSYMLGVAEHDRDRCLTALRRIASLEAKNVSKYAQQIAREALSLSSPDRAEAVANTRPLHDSEQEK